MAHFVKHVGCDKCGSSDANAIYSDGSRHCFSCGWNSGANRPGWVDVEEDPDIVVVPENITTEFPQVVLDWIKPTTITVQELIRARYFFHNFTSRLGRVCYNDLNLSLPKHRRGRECAIEYRNFNPTKEGPKAVFKGSKEDARAPAGHHLLQQTGQLVIVEDSLSSLRVGRYACSEPLFGSSVSNNKLSRIIAPAEEVVVWLDSDKYRSAVDIASRCKTLGKKARVVVTDLDPKYVDNIAEYLK